MSLDCGRKPEHMDKTDNCGGTCKLHREKLDPIWASNPRPSVMTHILLLLSRTAVEYVF